MFVLPPLFALCVCVRVHVRVCVLWIGDFFSSLLMAFGSQPKTKNNHGGGERRFVVRFSFICLFGGGKGRDGKAYKGEQTVPRATNLTRFNDDEA